MKKELIFDIELSPKTRVSNKSPFLTVDTTIKIPYYSQLKEHMPNKNILVTYTDTERPDNLDSIQTLKECNRENYSEVDLSECFILLLYFKIEDGKVEMSINHGTSKKKKKRKIDKNNNNEEEELEDSMEGECKFHHYKRPCQFKQWGELQEKKYHDYCEMQIAQKTHVDIKTHFVKNRNHKIFMEAELVVPQRIAEFFGMARRRVGFRAIELINYRFELESEIYCAELMQKHVSKVNFSLDNSKITSLKFSEQHFLKTFEYKKVTEIITSLLQLEELDLSEISLKQNINFYNLLLPNLYHKCYKLKRLVLQGPKQQWICPGQGFYHFLCCIPQRNWNSQIYATVNGKEFSLERFTPEDLQSTFLPSNFQFDANHLDDDYLIDSKIKMENPFGEISNGNISPRDKKNGINYNNNFDYISYKNGINNINQNNLNNNFNNNNNINNNFTNGFLNPINNNNNPPNFTFVDKIPVKSEPISPTSTLNSNLSKMNLSPRDNTIKINIIPTNNLNYNNNNLNSNSSNFNNNFNNSNLNSNNNVNFFKNPPQLYSKDLPNPLFDDIISVKTNPHSEDTISFLNSNASVQLMVDNNMMNDDKLSSSFNSFNDQFITNNMNSIPIFMSTSNKQDHFYDNNLDPHDSFSYVPELKRSSSNTTGHFDFDHDSFFMDDHL